MSPIQLALERVVSGIHLTQQEAMDAMGVMAGSLVLFQI